jgi:murein DD-endopeptidase MepM/ murein hydrolase activator NlpD
MTGNHVVVRHATVADCYALYAHLRCGSLRVDVGDEVGPSTVIGEVGHTGNSTAPHLHFQLMTAADPPAATGIPCGFDGYERMEEGRWVATSSLPRLHERVRSVGEP